jgi:hypothetical protein
MTSTFEPDVRLLLRKTVAVLTLVFPAVVLAGEKSEVPSPAVPYPAGFREWRVIKFRIVGPESKMFATRGGVHFFYANDKAIEGFRAGRFPNGSAIVEEIVRTTEGDANFKGTFVEGERVGIDVMVKDGTLFKATGGWGFDSFKGDSTVGFQPPDVRSQCYACHSSKQGRDYVFSEIRRLKR